MKSYTNSFDYSSMLYFLSFCQEEMIYQMSGTKVGMLVKNYSSCHYALHTTLIRKNILIKFLEVGIQYYFIFEYNNYSNEIVVDKLIA